MHRMALRQATVYSALLYFALALPAVGQGRGKVKQKQPTDLSSVGGADSLNNLKFRNLGPSVAGGRVAAVVGVPGDRNVYYVGAAAGGVWKTIDGGDSWEAVFKDQATSSIGAVALAPSNPNVVWVGTGEGNPRNDVVDGRGVFMSPDAGKSWQFMGLGDVGQITRIVIDPANPDVVFVGALGHVWAPNAERGVFHTGDGGKTWQKVLFVNDTTGATDLIMVPGNPRMLFAGMWQFVRYPWELVSGGAGSGIYRSKDGGLTWERLTEGLPTGLTGRIALAVRPTNPSHVYALIESKQGMLWDSKDQGDHWTKVSDSHALSARPFYFSLMHVSPVDDRKVFFSSYLLLRSDDGGKTTTPIDRGVHVDHHALWIDPQNPDRMIQGNDGGVYVTENGAKSWRFLNNLPIGQFYMVAADNNNPYMVCGGLQDNNAWCGPSSGAGGGGGGGVGGGGTGGGGGGRWRDRRPERLRVVHGHWWRRGVRGAGAERLVDPLRGFAERQHHARGSQDGPDPLHSTLPVRRDRNEAGEPEVPLQLDVTHRRVVARREYGVPGRQCGVQDHGRRRSLDGDQPRPHPERQVEASDERWSHQLRHLRRRDLQYDSHSHPRPDGFQCDLGRHGRRTRARDPGRREDMDQRVRPLPGTGEGRGGAGVPDRRLAVRRGRGVRRDRPPPTRRPAAVRLQDRRLRQDLGRYRQGPPAGRFRARGARESEPARLLGPRNRRGAVVRSGRRDELEAAQGRVSHGAGLRRAVHQAAA